MIRFHYYRFNSHGEKPFCPIDHLERAFCNLICYIAFGKRYEHDDENLQKMLQLLHRSFEVTNFAGLEGFLPFLRHVPFFGGLRDMEKIRDFSIKFFGDLIKETSSNYVPDDPRNFIDMYVDHAERVKQDQPPDLAAVFADPLDLLFSTADLFAAGTETSSTTVNWGLQYLVVHPTIQDKVGVCTFMTLGYLSPES